MLTKFHNSSNLSGIYKIVNLINNKLYIGSCKRFKERAYQHINSLQKNKHCNKHLQNAFNFYGSDSFVFEVIEVVNGTKEQRKLREQEFLNSYLNRWDELYNIRKDAQSPDGCKQSEEARKNRSELQTKHYKEHPEKRKELSDTIINLWESGVYNDRKSNSEAMKQLWADPIYRDKMIEARKGISLRTWESLPEDIKLQRIERVRQMGLKNRKRPPTVRKPKFYRILNTKTNEIIEINYKLSKWCKENLCSRQDLYKTRSGKLKHYKGFVLLQ